MTIATYSELVTELESYLNRTDYTPRIPTFIRLTEARLNRLLDDPDMEVRASITATEQYTALPLDYKRLIGVYTGNNYQLEQVSSAQITALNQTNTGDPRKYAISDGAITFAPISTGSVISILYDRTIPPLTAAAPTNWLLDRAPDLYLYGALIQAGIFGWFDERVSGFKALFDEALDEMRIDSSRRRWGSAPLSPRIGRT